MACFRGHNRCAYRIGVPHLAYQDHIRVCPEGIPQGVNKRIHICVQLSLVDNALIVLVNILDRIFNSDDVEPGTGVDIVNYCCQGG